MKMWILVFVLFSVAVACACHPPKQFEAVPYDIHTDKNGAILSIDRQSDTIEVDLNKTRYIKIRGRVYPLPTNQQCEEAEEDSVFTTQLSNE